MTAVVVHQPMSKVVFGGLAEINMPVPTGWLMQLDEAKQHIRLSGDGWKVTFDYGFYGTGGVGNDTRTFLKDNVLVQSKGYGRRWRASNALERLATGWGMKAKP